MIDEIEKGLSGSKSSGQTDGGTTSRVLGTFLTWLQDKTKPVFVICTANDHMSIPPEFMRAGRFDEVFFVDLPTKTEREDIYKVLLRRYGRNYEEFDLKRLASLTNNHSGAEIEKSIVTAMFEGFSDGQRPITTDDIAKALKTFKPLYDLRKEDFDSIREWAKGRTVSANTDEEIIVPSSGKMNLDLE